MNSRAFKNSFHPRMMQEASWPYPCAVENFKIMDKDKSWIKEKSNAYSISLKKALAIMS